MCMRRACVPEKNAVSALYCGGMMLCCGGWEEGLVSVSAALHAHATPACMFARTQAQVAAYQAEEAQAAGQRRAAQEKYRAALEQQVGPHAPMHASCMHACMDAHLHAFMRLLAHSSWGSTLQCCRAEGTCCPRLLVTQPHTHARTLAHTIALQILDFEARALADDIPMTPRERQLNGRMLAAARAALQQ